MEEVSQVPVMKVMKVIPGDEVRVANPVSVAILRP